MPPKSTDCNAAALTNAKAGGGKAGVKYQVNFEYKQIGDDDKPLRSRGAQLRLNVTPIRDNGYVVNAIGDDYQGRGDTIKDAILDYLSQCPLA